jgi:hypothetical protein
MPNPRHCPRDAAGARSGPLAKMRLYYSRQLANQNANEMATLAGRAPESFESDCYGPLSFPSSEFRGVEFTLWANYKKYNRINHLKVNFV